jgi:hypothetical protein
MTELRAKSVYTETEMPEGITPIPYTLVLDIKRDEQGIAEKVQIPPVCRRLQADGKYRP